MKKKGTVSKKCLEGDPKTVTRGKRLSLKSKYKMPETTRYQNDVRKSPDENSMIKRTKEADWKLVNREHWKESQVYISNIKENSAQVKSKYGFSPDFDLADYLIGVLSKYLRDSARPPTKKTVDQHTKNIDKAYKTGSEDSLTDFDKLILALFGEPKSIDEPTDRGDQGKIRRSIRALRAHNQKVLEDIGEIKAGGRHEDSAKARAVRSLGLVFYIQKGEIPKSGGNLESYATFVKEACELLDVEVTERALKYYLVGNKDDLDPPDNPKYVRILKGTPSLRYALLVRERGKSKKLDWFESIKRL